VKLQSLDDSQPEAPQFADRCVDAIQRFGYTFLKVSDTDERWSLTECGLRETDWEKIRRWGRTCSAARVPRANTRVAGVMLIALSTAVARSLDKDEPLWHTVAEACSHDLQRALFGSNGYPVEAARDALSEACDSLGLRHQLNLTGKDRYWRTILLQFGFSAKVGSARLPYWLAGYSVPETITALLTEGCENSSHDFQALWGELEHWNRRSADPAIGDRLRLNPWYPFESHHLFEERFASGRTADSSPRIRAEDEDCGASLFSFPQLRDTTLDFKLSSLLPSEVFNAQAAVLRLHIDGLGWHKLVLSQSGKRELNGDAVKVNIFDALQRPSREVTVFGGSGSLYREQLSFWPAEEDFVLFRGRTGRRVSDLEHFVPEVGLPYSLIARVDVRLQSAAQIFECVERGEEWCLYRFQHGLPSNFSASIEGTVVWTPGSKVNQPKPLLGASLAVHEISPTRLQLTTKLPRSWSTERFRFGGQEFIGSNGSIEISPAFSYEGRLAQAVIVRGAERRSAELQAGRLGPVAQGAAFQASDGSWREIDPVIALDAGLIEGRALGIRWDTNRADDPWLMLGAQPLRPSPRTSRRQRFVALGDPLYLRFGLMNEDRAARLSISPAVYSTGLLARIEEAEDLYILRLRDRFEMAAEIRVFVWERGFSEPRLLPPDEVEADSECQMLSILRLSAHRPIGWALVLDGSWQGSRFHADPSSQLWPELVWAWCEALASNASWHDLCALLRWWRFPALMSPFREVMEEQVSRHPLPTLRAWLEPLNVPEMFTGAYEAHYTSPLRNLLWDYQPSAGDCAQLHDAVLDCFPPKTGLSAPILLLLDSHPILVAKCICHVLWSKEREAEGQVPDAQKVSFFHRGREPHLLDRIELEYRQYFEFMIRRIHEYAQCSGRDNRTATDCLRQAALSELRSSSDPNPLDDRYFHEYIVQPAENLFDGISCDTNRLQVAIARSPACCAYIASHLLRVKGIKDRI
jgi:hypothetical protein